MTGSLKPINNGRASVLLKPNPTIFYIFWIDLIICIIYASTYSEEALSLASSINIIVLYINITTIGCHGLCGTLIINQFWCSFLALLGISLSLDTLDTFAGEAPDVVDV